MSLTIFGNIYINDKLKLEMLKISCNSFLRKYRKVGFEYKRYV